MILLGGLKGFGFTFTWRFHIPKSHGIRYMLGLSPAPRMPVANEGLGWDPLLKMEYIILVVTGILGGRTTQGIRIMFLMF